jgi:hypothetical protein
VAGIAAGDLRDTVTRIGEASSGVPMQALEQVIERMQTSAHASWADMRELTLATNGATQGEADQFRARAIQQVAYERDSKSASEAAKTAFQQSQEKASGPRRVCGKDRDRGQKLCRFYR